MQSHVFKGTLSRLVIALVGSLIIALACGVITLSGELYSPSFHFRHQTDALLRFEMALSSSPTDLQPDLAWHRGVQQVWGLGIPVLRMPFEAIGKRFGLDMFPDRIVFCFALALLLYLAHTVGLLRDNHLSYDTITVNRRMIIYPLMIAAFPPFMTICRGPFFVYEEAAAYGYVVSSISILCSLIYYYKPSWTFAIGAGISSGLCALVRPTCAIYGMIAMCLCLKQPTKEAKWSKCICGVIYLLSAALMLYTNYKRFGSALEFGHKINFTGPELVQASRFTYEYANEPLIPAAKELLGALFLNSALSDDISKSTFPLMSTTPRWRYFYHTLYDPSYLGLMSFAMLLLCRIQSQRLTSASKALTISFVTLCVFIGATGSIAQFLFYLRFHAIFSRYLVDFAPAFAFVLIGLFETLCLTRSNQLRCKWLVDGLPTVIIMSWWLWQNTNCKFRRESAGYSYSQIHQSYYTLRRLPAVWPSSYRVGSMTSPIADVSVNGDGWNYANGDLYHGAASFVIPSARQVCLLVSGVPIGELSAHRLEDTVALQVGSKSIRPDVVSAETPGVMLRYNIPLDKTFAGPISLFLSIGTTPDGIRRFTLCKLIELSWN